MTETTDDLEAMCVRVAQAMGYRWWCFTPYGALPVLREPEFEHDLVATRYMARCEQPSHITEAMLSMVPRPDRDPAAFRIMLDWLLRHGYTFSAEEHHFRYGPSVRVQKISEDAPPCYGEGDDIMQAATRAVAAAIRAREEAGNG